MKMTKHRLIVTVKNFPCDCGNKEFDLIHNLWKTKSLERYHRKQFAVWYPITGEKTGQHTRSRTYRYEIECLMNPHDDGFKFFPFMILNYAKYLKSLGISFKFTLKSVEYDLETCEESGRHMTSIDF